MPPAAKPKNSKAHGAPVTGTSPPPSSEQQAAVAQGKLPSSRTLAPVIAPIYTQSSLIAASKEAMPPNSSDAPRQTDEQESNDLRKEEIAKGDGFVFETVDEIWDTASSRYKIVPSNSTITTDEESNCVFTARRKIERTGDATAFIDVKSKLLLDALQAVFVNAKKCTSLNDEKPSVERKVLYLYLNELEEHLRSAQDALKEQLTLLVDYVNNSYAVLKESLRLLLERGEITFGRLWTMFKPNDIIIGKCEGTEQERAVLLDWTAVKKLPDGTKYFHIEGRYLDFNGKVTGQATTAFGIIEFPGTRRLVSLDTIPLSFHPRADSLKIELEERGRRFQELAGVHYKEYRGIAFAKTGDGPVKVHVDGRIMVDAARFYEVNPNYTKPRFNDSRDRDIFGQSSWDQSQLREPDLAMAGSLLCSPTVLGFSFKTKEWLEFAVAQIEDVCWNPELFRKLNIPEDRKNLIRSVALGHIQNSTDFDDFVRGKGKGLVMLLHGSPGVGKTLTAEGLSEHLCMPLYSVSSADISHDLRLAERQLSEMFEQARKWKALLLLDEADVFLRPRELDHSRDSLTMLFLRTLEYSNTIVILTTNRLQAFDHAIGSRIDLPLKYDDLGKDARRALWTEFLDMIKAELKPREIEELAGRTLDGRQIKNAVKMAGNSASSEGGHVTLSILEGVLRQYNDFQRHFDGHGAFENKRAYT